MRAIVIVFVLTQCALGWVLFRTLADASEAVGALQDPGQMHSTREGSHQAQGVEQQGLREIEAARREAQREFEQVAARLPERLTTAEIVEHLHGASMEAGCRLTGIAMGDAQHCCGLTVTSLRADVIVSDTAALLHFVDRVEARDLSMSVQLSQLPLFSEPRTVNLSLRVHSLLGVDRP